jgi:hypothetical protein
MVAPDRDPLAVDIDVRIEVERALRGGFGY